MRLIAVELRRYFSRWAIRIGWIAAAVFIALLGVGNYFSAAPPTEAQIAEAQKFYEQDHAQWLEHGDEWEADCRADEENAREMEDDPTISYGCDEMEPQLEHYMWNITYQEDVKAGLYTSGVFIVLPLALALGITFMAGEFTTGTMSTWLTFEPRRQRVYASKLAAAGIGSGLLAAISYAVLWLIFQGITAAYDLQPAGADHWQDLADSPFGAIVLRVVALTIAAGLIGVALSAVIRHTAGAIITVAGYLVVEQIVRGIFASFGKYALTTHVQGVILKGASYYVDVCETVAGGTQCEYTEQTVDFGVSVAVMGALTLIMVLVGAWRFQRRDVA